MAATRPAQSQYALVRRARRMGRILAQTYPDAHCELNFNGPYQLLVATILSAQCTDVRVNQVTPAVFARYPNPAAMAQADRDELEGLIASTGFFRNKATSLLGMSAKLVSDYGGQVPRRMEQLVTLPGVGRKTANVVLGNAFGVPGITVDTHVGRLSRRFGWTSATDPDQVESDVSALFPKRDWTVLSHRVIWHGRRICNARRPACGACPLAQLCPAFGTGEMDPQVAARLVKSGPEQFAPERRSDNAELDNSEPDNAELDNAELDNSEPDNSEPDNSEPDKAQVDKAGVKDTDSPDAVSEQMDPLPGHPVVTHQGQTRAHAQSPAGTTL